MLIQANRPVYNATYTSTLYNNTDNHFDFEFAPFDQLNFNDDNIDNQLTALIAYYAYLIIGINLDSFAPMGGETVLQRCMTLPTMRRTLALQVGKHLKTRKTASPSSTITSTEV